MARGADHEGCVDACACASAFMSGCVRCVPAERVKESCRGAVVRDHEVWVAGALAKPPVCEGLPSFFPITISEPGGAASVWLTERSVLLPEPPLLFGWVAVLPTGVRGAETGATLGAAGAGVTPALPLPGRMSDRARPPYAGCAPADWENCGRKTDRVWLFASSRSPRVP
jgi:hypothetical protein